MRQRHSSGVDREAASEVDGEKYGTGQTLPVVFNRACLLFLSWDAELDRLFHEC